MHHRGVAVDVALVEAHEPLDMGSPFDAFDARSAFEGVSGAPLKRRAHLRRVMVAAGFQPYDQEWWHFELGPRDAPRLDVPYGAQEPMPAGAPRP